tara:strand:- start:314 stop:838 length:525 start_codon:yes stop_codon:yes gene_type:complete
MREKLFVFAWPFPFGECCYVFIQQRIRQNVYFDRIFLPTIDAARFANDLRQFRFARAISHFLGKRVTGYINVDGQALSGLCRNFRARTVPLGSGSTFSNVGSGVLGLRHLQQYISPARHGFLFLRFRAVRNAVKSLLWTRYFLEPGRRWRPSSRIQRNTVSGVMSKSLAISQTG